MLGIFSWVSKTWRKLGDYQRKTPKDKTATTGRQAEREAADTRATARRPKPRPKPK
jgi:hypothetical protein